MILHVVMDYPKDNDEGVFCNDCFDDFTDAEKKKLNTWELEDPDAITEDEKCVGSCKRVLTELM